MRRLFIVGLVCFGAMFTFVVASTVYDQIFRVSYTDGRWRQGGILIERPVSIRSRAAE